MKIVNEEQIFDIIIFLSNEMILIIIDFHKKSWQTKMTAILLAFDHKKITNNL